MAATPVGVIVQARAGSTRLPGKVLMPLAGRTVLAHVLERCRAIGTAAVCCAVPAGARDDGVANAARLAGVEVYRGSEDDVLDRYLQAARLLRLAVIVRVTADCPLIDPEICRTVIDLFDRSGADYACNNLPPSWPHGLDVEVISRDWLERAAREAVEPWQREHVTPFVRRHPDARRVSLPMPPPGRPQCRWTLDHPDDFRFISYVYDRLPSGPIGWDYRQVMAIADGAPAAVLTNQKHDRNEGLKRSMAGRRARP